VSNRTIEDLTHTFASAVLEQNRCLSRGDPRSGNREARRYGAAAKELLDGGHESIEAFVTLLSHLEPAVRAMAAAFLLEERTALAIETLRPIAAGSGLAALGAQMTLERYERGELGIK
jgi:hypothetical protein